METKTEAFSRGFDRGNYGNAYESQDWNSWYASNCQVPPEFEGVFPDYTEGLIVGFHASYEIHEIADDIVAETVATLRAKYGEEP